MAVTLEMGDGTTRQITKARTLFPETRIDREAYRSPFSSNVFYGGARRRGAERVAVEFEAHDGAIAVSATLASTILADFQDTVLITTPLGVWEVEGIESVSRQPSENGYRITVTLIARTARASDDSGVLRFISGPVWRLR